MAGFFGPMALNPDANQGPLVGIFISGPAGLFFGFLLWAICRIVKVSAAPEWMILWGFSAVLGMVTLYSCLPKPALRGYVLEAQIQSCQTPIQTADQAIAYWEKRVAEVTWFAPRPDWQAESRRNLQNDPAVVLDVTALKKNLIYENRKPWNKGSYFAKGWDSTTESKSYYAQYAGSVCSDYPPGAKTTNFVLYDMSPLNEKTKDWPPKKIPAFLNLEPLESVPPEYQVLLEK